ncbi:unnamed protein product, partial [marine sediment metagenome]
KGLMLVPLFPIFSANNITLDCQGYTIDGDESVPYGI